MRLAVFIWVVCLLTFILRMLFTLFYAEPVAIDMSKIIFDPFPFGYIENFGFWNYVYHGAERVSWLLFSFTVALITGNGILKMFCIVKFVDMADYFLDGNTVYYFLPVNDYLVPISYNVLSFIFWLMFGIYLLDKWIQRQL